MEFITTCCFLCLLTRTPVITIHLMTVITSVFPTFSESHHVQQNSKSLNAEYHRKCLQTWLLSWTQILASEGWYNEYEGSLLCSQQQLTLSWARWVQSTTCAFNIHFNITFHAHLFPSSDLSPTNFPFQNSVRISHLFAALFYPSNNIWSYSSSFYRLDLMVSSVQIYLWSNEFC